MKNQPQSSLASARLAAYVRTALDTEANQRVTREVTSLANNLGAGYANSINVLAGVAREAVRAQTVTELTAEIDGANLIEGLPPRHRATYEDFSRIEKKITNSINSLIETLTNIRDQLPSNIDETNAALLQRFATIAK